MFNLMKKRYRKTNCYTPNQLLEFVKTSNEDVELVDVMNGGGGFKNWDKYENKYMRCPDAIQGFHLFTVTSNEPNRLVCQAAHGFPPHYDDTIVRKEFRDKPWESLWLELEGIDPVGMKDIKWITLYDEWRPLIPVDLRKDYQYYHTDPGPECREKTKLNRGESAAARKNRETTIDNDIIPKKRAAAAKKPKPAPAKKKAPKKAAPKKKAAPTKDDDKKPAAKKKPPAKHPKQAAAAKKQSTIKKRGPFQFGKL
jgi:hypothetical protein